MLIPAASWAEYGVQDVIEVAEEGVVVRVGAEVDLSEGVGGAEGGGLLVDVLLEHWGENLSVETQEVPVKFIGHDGVGPEPGGSGLSETSTQRERTVYWLRVERPAAVGVARYSKRYP